MARSKAIIDPSCEQCGYALHSLADPAEHATCPECGTPADPDAPWKPVPWPSTFQRALTMCGPVLAVAVALLALSATRGTRNWLVWPLTLPWVIALVIFAWIWPIGIAKMWAQAREPRISRRAAVLRIASPALIFNTAAVVGTIVVFFLLL